MISATTDGSGAPLSLEALLRDCTVPLRRSLVARFGVEVGVEAHADAIAYAVEHGQRLLTMQNPLGYLFRVGQSSARRTRRWGRTFRLTTDPAVRAPLQPGAASDDVVELQTGLAALGLAVDATGLYDGQTEQAVWAFKTLFAGVSHTDLALDDAPSVVTSELWQQIESAQPLRPRRPGAAGSTHVEIYLPEQALAVFTNDEVALIAHVSSGNGAAWCETVRPDVDATGRAIAEPIEIPVCGVSTTPGGVFTVEHVVQGDFTGPLGRMINPLYFNHGIAIHGSRVVPLSAASHGGVRVIPQVADRLLDLVSVGDEVDVWGTDGRDPEQYTTTEMLPTFTFPDPNASAVVTPLLSGLTAPKARDLLAVKGLGIDVSYRDVAVGDPQIGRVIEQSPQFNESVPPGTTIRVTVGRALESPETPTPTT